MIWLFLFVIVVLLAMPCALIWALNVLFGLGIVLSLKTWVATLILASLFFAGGSKN